MSEKKKQKKDSKKVPKKNNKKINIIIAIASVIVILFIVISFILSLQIKIVLQEQMRLSLTPLVVSEDVITGNSPEVTFNLDIKRPKICKAQCSFELVDISENKLLKNNTIFDVYKRNFTYTLPIPSYGEGQKLFNFKVTCNNRKSNICNTNEKKYFKTSLITVNYEFSKEEKEVKNELNTDLKKYYASLHESDIFKKEINEIISSVNYPAVSKFKKEGDSIQINVNKDYLNLWEEEKYYALSDIFTFKNAVNTKNELIILKRNLKNNITKFNHNLETLNSIASSNELKEAFILRNREELNSSAILFLKEEIESLYITLENRTMNSFDDFDIKVKEIETSYKLIKKEHESLKKSVETEGKTRLNILENLLNMRKTNSTSSICTLMNNRTLIAEKNNAQSMSIIDNNYSHVNKTVLLENVNKYFLSKLDGTNFSSSLNVSNWDEILITNSSYIFNPYYRRHCLQTNVVQFHIKIPKNMQIEYNITKQSSDIITILPENNPTCCVYGKCENCTNNPDENYPVIFIHGHAVSKENRPEASHEAFAKIQELMEDEFYVNAGQLGGEEIPKIGAGEWGRFNSPITVRVSYYLLSYYGLGSYSLVTQKTDKLENYAIRLNELINIIKQKTGKNKVNLVAHSMGGLVVREYERLFGDDSINQVITLGTPNKGIEGRVKNLCSLTGASRECRDMYNDSIFIQKLNAHTPEIPFSTIRANGCVMGGELGDGVVLARNVPLSFAKNYEVKGECTDLLNSNLHTRFLDPVLYPKTYATVLKILSSEEKE